MDVKMQMIVHGFLIVHQIIAPVSYMQLVLRKTMTFHGYPVKKNAKITNVTFP